MKTNRPEGIERKLTLGALQKPAPMESHSRDTQPIICGADHHSHWQSMGKAHNHSFLPSQMIGRGTFAGHWQRDHINVTLQTGDETLVNIAPNTAFEVIRMKTKPNKISEAMLGVTRGRVKLTTIKNCKTIHYETKTPATNRALNIY